MRGPAFAAMVLTVASVVAACAAPAPSADVRVHVENQTDIPVGVYVDGDWRGTDEAGATLVVPLGDGTPPITIEVRSPSGAVLASFVAQPGPVDALREGGTSSTGDAFAVPCGVISINVGELQAGEALAPAPAVEPGPCP